MCAILDANVANKVFRANRSGACQAFYKWINVGNGQLVIGGKLRHELAVTRARDWLGTAIKAGRVRQLNDERVDERTRKVESTALCKSDDPHVIALAQLSGARLLYSDEPDLHEDFGNKQLIDEPRGKVYSTLRYQDLRDSHKNLLTNRNLCKQSATQENG